MRRPAEGDPFSFGRFLGIMGKRRSESLHTYERNWRRLPLEGCANARDLGGYPVAGGLQTRWHRYVRADRLSHLTDSDVAFLRAYGVRLVLDLRSDREAEEHPDRSLGDGIMYRRVTLMDFNAADAEETRRRLGEGKITPGDAYKRILSNREGIVSALRACLEVPDSGCVLFHCTEGKDRTGVFSLLLLMLAGVDRQDCIGDYEVTCTHLLRKSYYREAYAHAGAFRDMLGSLPQTIATVYDELSDTYGGVTGFLETCGLKTTEIERLRRGLIDG